MEAESDPGGVPESWYDAACSNVWTTVCTITTTLVVVMLSVWTQLALASTETSNVPDTAAETSMACETESESVQIETWFQLCPCAWLVLPLSAVSRMTP